jgi:ribosomal protein S18 acetylase RimI-like enzyme
VPGTGREKIQKNNTGQGRKNTEKSFIIRKGEIKDLEDFINLIHYASDNVFAAIFDLKVSEVLKFLFVKSHNLFSFTHTIFIEANQKPAGMLLGYDFDDNKQDILNTGVLMLRKLNAYSSKIICNLLKAERVIGKVNKGEFYISNVAVYPEFRGIGLGNELMLNAEKIARSTKNKSISLDVEVQNEGAINLYKKLGFKIIGNIKILKLREAFKFYRMIKKL